MNLSAFADGRGNERVFRFALNSIRCPALYSPANNSPKKSPSFQVGRVSPSAISRAMA